MPSNLLLLLVALTLLSLSCRGDGSLGDGGWLPEGDVDADTDIDTDSDTDADTDIDTDADTDADTDTDTDTDADAGGGLDYCSMACITSDDCGSPSAAYDEDNYECDGLCVYSGCNSDEECASTYMNDQYLCRDMGTGISACVLSCNFAADCAQAAPAVDEDNYECAAGGLCRYTGCNNDEECSATYSDSRYVCREAEVPDVGVPVPSAARNCVLGCATAADCVTSAAFDEDNYECADGVCRYTGCNNDTECAETFMDERYVCR